MGRNERYFISGKKLWNVALKWDSHIERMQEERILKKKACSTGQCKEEEVESEKHYIVTIMEDRWLNM
jgi:hypothetical protein